MAIKERPILFSGPMVRAILEGRKTQTRRACKHQYWSYSEIHDVNKEGFTQKADRNVSCPYGSVGDRLWVRENHVFLDKLIDNVDREDPCVVGFQADDSIYRFEPEPARNPVDKVSNWNHGPWRPSIFLPQWASRLTLEITSIRVERLQDISEEDALAEGVAIDKGSSYHVAGHEGKWAHATARGCFETLWDSINAKRGYPWKANPWVWVITFKRIPALDALVDPRQ